VQTVPKLALVQYWLPACVAAWLAGWLAEWSAVSADLLRAFISWSLKQCSAILSSSRPPLLSTSLSMPAGLQERQTGHAQQHAGNIDTFTPLVIRTQLQWMGS
jgi:hypothetical protein